MRQNRWRLGASLRFGLERGKTLAFLCRQCALPPKSRRLYRRCLSSRPPSCTYWDLSFSQRQQLAPFHEHSQGYGRGAREAREAGRLLSTRMKIPQALFFTEWRIFLRDGSLDRPSMRCKFLPTAVKPVTYAMAMMHGSLIQYLATTM